MIRLQNGVGIRPAIETRCAAAPSWRASLVVAPSIASSAVWPRSAQVPCSGNGIGCLIRPLGPLRNCDFRVGLAGDVSGLTMPNTDGRRRMDRFKPGVCPFSTIGTRGAAAPPHCCRLWRSHFVTHFASNSSAILNSLAHEHRSRNGLVRLIRPLGPLP